MAKRTCSYPGCDKPHAGRGFCRGHYRQMKKGRPMTPIGYYRNSVPTCSFPGCGRQNRCLQLCSTHYDQQRTGRPLTPIRSYGASRKTYAPMSCATCGAQFTPRSKVQRYCSVLCMRKSRRNIWVPVRHPCKGCGEQCETGHQRWCDTCRPLQRKAHQRNMDHQHRIAGKSTTRHTTHMAGDRPTYAKVAARDGWKCHLCGKKIDPRLKWPHKRSVTIDHLIPVSTGGEDVMSNVRLAHLDCNSGRRERGIVQLLLV